MNDKKSELVLPPERERDEPAYPMAQQSSPGLMLMTAIQRGMDPGTIKDLMALSREHDAYQALKAYNVAFAAFKSEAVKIIKGTDIKDGPLKGKKHANLFDVVSGVTPALAKHGLSMSWKLTKDDPQWMEVTCTVKHVAGHAESTSMGAAPDTGPGRNAIQARGSSQSYLSRYTALALLGLAAQDQDDDAMGGPAVEAFLEGAELEEFQKRAKAAIVNLPKFLSFIGAESLDKVPLTSFQKGMGAIQEREKVMAKKADKESAK